jgi:hypothetical protein
MAEEGQAATQSESSGASPQPDQGELIGTMDLAPKAEAKSADAEPEGANNTGAQKAEDGKPQDGKGEGKPADAGAEGDAAKNDDRLDKHPRFQQLIAERDALKTSVSTLTARMDGLEAKGANGTDANDSGDSSPMAKLADMDKNELADFITDNPHEYSQMILDQAKTDVTSELSEKMNQGRFEDAVVHELEAFASQNEDFDPMWESGVLKQFMQSHPGQNAISAYYLLTADKRKGEVDGMIEEAVKKAEDKFTANQKAKNQISVIPSAPQGAGNTRAVDAELKDTKKFGGDKTVLASRLTRFRQAKQGGMI